MRTGINLEELDCYWDSIRFKLILRGNLCRIGENIVEATGKRELCMGHVIYQMALLFILISIGYISNKTKILDSEGNKRISKLVMNVTTPATIFTSVIGNHIENKSEVWMVFILAILPFVIFPILSKIAIKVIKIPGDKRTAFEVMLVFPNVGFMGIPVISGLYGKHAVFYVSFFILIFNIAFFTYGVTTLKKSSNSKIKLREILNPGIISALLAIPIFLFEIPFPKIIVESCNILGGLTTPLAMLIIGSTMASVALKEVFLQTKLYLFAMLRLLIYPIVIWLLLKNFVFNETILAIAVLLSGMPTAASVVMACEEYGNDSSFVSKGIFLSTLGSMFTIPLLTLLLTK